MVSRAFSVYRAVPPDLGINKGRWASRVNMYRRERPHEEKPLPPAERANMADLQADNRELRMRLEFLGVHVTFAEDGAGWLGFFRGPRRRRPRCDLTRGLTGERLVTSDAHTAAWSLRSAPPCPTRRASVAAPIAPRI